MTKFDILEAMPESGGLDNMTAARTMQRQATVAHGNASMNHVIQLMLRDNFALVPVVNDDT